MSKYQFLFYVAVVLFLIYVVVSVRKRISSRFNTTSARRFHRSKLVSVLLSLDDKAVDELMRLYKAEFGNGPARYARKTFKKWRTGEVQPATQTFERFLIRLPKVMSYDLKCDVLRHFMEEYASKDNYKLDVFTDNWQVKIDPLVQQIIDKAFTAQLPSALERKLRWLGDGDMQAAQALLRASQVEESRIMVSMLHEEFEGIEKVLAEEHLKPRVSHVLKFPYGTIELNIKRR